MKALIWRHRYGVLFGLAAGGLIAAVQLLISHTPTFAMWLYLVLGGFVGYNVDEAVQRPRRKVRAPASNWIGQAIAAVVCFWGTIHFFGWRELLDFFGNWWASLLIGVSALTWTGLYMWKHGRRLEIFKPVWSKVIAALLFILAGIILWIYLGRPASSLLEDIAQNRGPQWFWASLCFGFIIWCWHRMLFERRTHKKKS